MSVRLVLQDATIDGLRNFISGKGKPCFVLELSYHGGSQSLFMEQADYAALVGKVKVGMEADVICSGKWDKSGKFEAVGAPEVFPAGAVSIDTKPEPAAVRPPRAAA